MSAPSSEPPAPKPEPEPRSAYPHLQRLTTRWRDNDVYGHMNNVVYYEYFDTVVNAWLIERGLLEIETSPVIGLVVETACSYFAPLGFPDDVTAGLRVARIGGSSVTYEIGLFRGAAPEAAAQGRFTHVYVDRATRRPTPLAEPMRAALGALRRA
ncbi:MAG: thioesterase family protein [Pseudomonadota bacterium]